MKIKLPSGTTGFINDAGKWICTGSQMGRRNVIPESGNAKLHLRRLRLVDGDYDCGGAYWGSPNNLYIAFTAHFLAPNYQAEILPNDTQVYVRANSRHEARQKVLALVSGAKFYR